jgi:hypothetical protein
MDTQSSPENELPVFLNKDDLLQRSASFSPYAEDMEYFASITDGAKVITYIRVDDDKYIRMQKNFTHDFRL